MLIPLECIQHTTRGQSNFPWSKFKCYQSEKRGVHIYMHVLGVHLSNKQKANKGLIEMKLSSRKIIIGRALGKLNLNFAIHIIFSFQEEIQRRESCSGDTFCLRLPNFYHFKRGTQLPP